MRADPSNTRFLPRETDLGPYVVVAAHPDDEVIGLASFLPAWRQRVVVVHLTDGAPVNGQAAAHAGFHSNVEYGQARQQEAWAALELAGLEKKAIISLGFQDQGLSFQLPRLAHCLADLFERLRPAIVFVHPYEGGHPDHDAASFAASSALRLCRSPGTRLFEYCSYHAGGHGMVTSDFVAASDLPVCSKRLNTSERELKQRMFDCFKTQLEMLANFSTEVERIRSAPLYDYARAPHPGRLFYEHYDWGIDGESWRSLAQQAAERLRI